MFRCWVYLLVRMSAIFMVCALAQSAAIAATDDVLAHVRARGFVRCSSSIRPGIAVPTLDGKHWYGLAPDICRAVAAAVLGSRARIEFGPYSDSLVTRKPGERADIVFLGPAVLVGGAAQDAEPLQLGPVIAHDAQALLVSANGARNVAELRDKSICVEPGSPADRALISYFAQHAIALHEHPFQETDEMRQAYAAHKCDALAGPLTTLASVRADPQDGRRSDRILPVALADDPIFAATAGDARWSRIVWWTFSALVDAEDARTATPAAERDAAVPGVPPAVGRELGLAPQWARNALAASGDYGQIFAHNLGDGSRLALSRGANALRQNGGLIFGLSVR